jgi:hypothetical protein
MKKLRVSTIVLISIGAAMLALGTVAVLTIPKDSWISMASIHDNRMRGFPPGYSDAEKSDGAGNTPQADDSNRFGPGLRWRGRGGAMRLGPGMAARGLPGRQGMPWRGPACGLFFLALVVGMGAGFVTASKRGKIPMEKGGA